MSFAGLCILALQEDIKNTKWPMCIFAQNCSKNNKDKKEVGYKN